MKKGSSLRDRVSEIRDYVVYEKKFPPYITYGGLSEEEKSVLNFFIFVFARDYLATAKKAGTLKKRMLKISQLAEPLPKSNKGFMEIPLPKRARPSPKPQGN